MLSSYCWNLSVQSCFIHDHNYKQCFQTGNILQHAAIMKGISNSTKSLHCLITARKISKNAYSSVHCLLIVSSKNTILAHQNFHTLEMLQFNKMNELSISKCLSSRRDTNSRPLAYMTVGLLQSHPLLLWNIVIFQVK